MKILIIYAYPNTTGYTHAILNNIHQGTEQQNTVKIIDLYKENFDPVLVFNEQKKEEICNLMKKRPFTVNKFYGQIILSLYSRFGGAVCLRF